MDNETSTIYHKLCTSIERLQRLTVENNDSSKFENQISKEQGTSLRLFGTLLYTKILNDTLENLAGDHALEQWFHITNVDIDKLMLLKEEISDVVDLLHFGRSDLHNLCDRCKFSHDEKLRFVSATSNLRIYLKTWLDSKIEPLDEFTDKSLSWYGCESSPESSEVLLSPEQDSVQKLTNQQLPLLVYNHPYDDQQQSTSTGRGKTHKIVHQNDRRSLSVSESGADSGASDSGLSSAISQNSLPTTTPPHSPGCFATVVNNNRASPSPHHPHKICKGGRIMSAATVKICQSRTLPTTASSSSVQQVLVASASLANRRRQSNTAACLVGAGVTPPASPSYLSVTAGAIQQ
uniref:Uncharacterized protein n=1 Tax=Romanomermis culicivorax TaxID=13658 RepID=A0A915K7T1_ROMCU